MTIDEVKLSPVLCSETDAMEDILDADSTAELAMDAAEGLLTKDELMQLKSSSQFFDLLRKKEFGLRKFKKALKYEQDLRLLQGELVKLQQWAHEKQRRIAIIYEGRDAAGKGGTIRRFVEHLNPRATRIVALPKPTEEESGEWYFQRYINNLPRQGKIVFFDRSWYNRAVVEPVNGFCTQEEYSVFMNQVNDFERMLIESGIRLIKFYFSISKNEQAKRFDDIKSSPLKKWKFSKVDQKAIELWDSYTDYKNKMFEKTNTEISPWIIIKANRKSLARIEAMEKMLELIPYKAKEKVF